MKTFYSLIKVSPNPSAGDLFTIGIVVAGQSEVFVSISDNKLRWYMPFYQKTLPLSILSFNKSQQTVHSLVSDYITLITEIEKKYKKETDNNFYLIADEPEQSTKEHLLWNKVRSLKKIKLITSDDTDEVAGYIEKSGATTFIVPAME
jgi:hypothetical protein